MPSVSVNVECLLLRASKLIGSKLGGNKSQFTIGTVTKSKSLRGCKSFAMRVVWNMECKDETDEISVQRFAEIP